MVCKFKEIDSSRLIPQSSLGAPVELLVGDIKDSDTCLKASYAIDIIVHLAANTGVGPSVEDPRHDMEANVIGTFNMLEAARRNNVKRFIFASSGASVGECEPPIHEELAAHPVSPYGAGKLAGEGYCSAYFRTFGLETVSLRFGNVYGPGSSNKNSVITKFIKQALTGEICKIFGDGNQSRDFIYIDDLTNAIMKVANFHSKPNSQPVRLGVSKTGPLSAEAEMIHREALASPLRPDSSNAFLLTPHLPWGGTFQIATNKEHTVNEVSEILKEVLDEYNVKMKVEYADPRIGDVRRNYSDTCKARNLLSWQSTTELPDGIKVTVHSFTQ